MPEDILNKLHTALRHISPLASEREKIIADMGEVIWLETLKKVLDTLPSDKRDQVVTFLNHDDLAGAIEICMESDVDVEALLRSTGEEVLQEVVAL